MKIKKSQTVFFQRHINMLCGVAGNVAFSEGVKIYKKLHREEARQHRIAEMECNGEIDLSDNETAKRDKRTVKRVNDLLPGLKTAFINGDPRGYALKFSSEEAREMRDKDIPVYTDWGGYGILAPDFQ